MIRRSLLPALAAAAIAAIPVITAMPAKALTAPPANAQGRNLGRPGAP